MGYAFIIYFSILFKECLGIIFENENTADGMKKVLHQIQQQYVPKVNDGENTLFHEVGIAGDQLTIERIVNCLLSLSNGFTQEERLEGIHAEIADWHAELKFLSLIFQRLYSTSSAEDKCTLFADRNLINRRNVSSDTHHNYSPNKQMLKLAVKARIITAGMKILGLTELSGRPTTSCYPADLSNQDKRAKKTYLRKLASSIVDEYVVDNKAITDILNSVLEQTEQTRAAANQRMTTDGRFLCRFDGCNKSFKHNGKRRVNHELEKHGLIFEEQLPRSSILPPPNESLLSNSSEHDDMYNYQCSIIDHGLLYLNFTDAIAEADGDRIMRCWKFLLLHFYFDGGKSAKYALEGLYLQFQQQAILTHRQAYCQRWNRSVNNHGAQGKNVPLDLDLEHDNNYLKEAMRKMGPSSTEKSVTRVCRALKIAREVVENVNRDCQVMRRSGVHFVTSNEKDLLKIINKLLEEKALTEIIGRKYKTFKDCERSCIKCIRMADFCKWINKHKQDIIIGRAAR